MPGTGTPEQTGLDNHFQEVNALGSGGCLAAQRLSMFEEGIPCLTKSVMQLQLDMPISRNNATQRLEPIISGSSLYRPVVNCQLPALIKITGCGGPRTFVQWNQPASGLALIEENCRHYLQFLRRLREDPEIVAESNDRKVLGDFAVLSNANWISTLFLFA